MQENYSKPTTTCTQRLFMNEAQILSRSDNRFGDRSVGGRCPPPAPFSMSGYRERPVGSEQSPRSSDRAIQDGCCANSTNGGLRDMLSGFSMRWIRRVSAWHSVVTE